MASTGADAGTAVTGPLRVVAAVIRRADRAILLSLRAADADQGGLWEFPGGKLEPGERDIDGLARELREELGIAIVRALPVIRVLHRYPDKLVSLSVMEVTDWEGVPGGREGQEIRWVQSNELAALRFPAANLPVTTAVNLPRLALVAPTPGPCEAAFLRRLTQCLAAGVRLVSLRLEEPDLARRRRVAKAAADACHRSGACLMIDGEPDDAIAAGAQGLHLTAARLRQLSVRPVPPGLLLSATCSTVHELRHAETLGADFACVSPVHAPAARPAIEPLGWHRLHALVKATRLPVFAHGGMRAADARLALRAGCQGVAMTQDIWNSAAPAETVEASAQAAQAAAYTIR